MTQVCFWIQTRYLRNPSFLVLDLHQHSHLRTYHEFICFIHLITSVTRGAQMPSLQEGLPPQLLESLMNLEPLEILVAEREELRSLGGFLFWTWGELKPHCQFQCQCRNLSYSCSNPVFAHFAPATSILLGGKPESKQKPQCLSNAGLSLDSSWHAPFRAPDLHGGAMGALKT